MPIFCSASRRLRRALSLRRAIYRNRWSHDFYAQDDVRLNTKLTLNIGVRYELHLPWRENSNRMSIFDIGTGSHCRAGWRAFAGEPEPSQELRFGGGGKRGRNVVAQPDQSPQA